MRLILAIMLAASIVFGASPTEIKISHGESKTLMESIIQSDTKYEAINDVINYLKALKAGSRHGSMDLQVGGGALVAAYSNLSVMNKGSTGDTLWIGGEHVLTSMAFGSTAGTSNYNTGSTATLTAASIVTGLNLGDTASYVTAALATTGTNKATHIIITLDTKGAVGNFVPIEVSTSADQATLTVNAASFQWGVDATANAFSFGY